MFQIDSLLTPRRALCRASGLSKKRIFEKAADLICADRHELRADEVYGNLLARERLGSTALGDGIAIPHCRVSRCSQAVGALVTLDRGIDFDAPDGKPVDMLFLLLAPEEAQQEHLNILAGLARLLGDHRFCQSLRNATDSASLYRAAVDFKVDSQP